MQTTVKELNKAEVLRYLGWRGVSLPSHMDGLVDSCIATTLQTINPKYLYRYYPIGKEKGEILIEGCDIHLTGKAIERHLGGCDGVYILCVTIGLEMEKLIRTSMLASPDAGVIYDSCASAAVEAVADLAQEEIRDACLKSGKAITSRFSPGYGDLPLETQKEFLRCMDSHRKIGLGMTDSLLLTPGKSITAVIGVTDKTDKNPYNCQSKCDSCTGRESCSFRAD